MNDKQHSPSIFFALVFILSIPFWILGAVLRIEMLPGLPISALAVLAPTLAACILVYKTDRWSGVLQILRRSFDFDRVKNKGWFLAILLINPARAFLAYGIMLASGVSFPEYSPFTLAIFPMFLFFFIGALAEEIGWTGYAIEPLLNRLGIIAASVVLGLVWMVYHFIPLLQVHRSVDWIAWWALGTVTLRIIMTWLFVHAGKSVFAAALFHTMINLCWQLFPVRGSLYDPKVFGWITLGFALVALIAERLLSSKKMQTA